MSNRGGSKKRRGQKVKPTDTTAGAPVREDSTGDASGTPNSESAPSSVRELIFRWVQRKFGRRGLVVLIVVTAAAPVFWQCIAKWGTIRSAVADHVPWSERLLYGALPASAPRKGNNFVIEVAYFVGDDGDDISNYIVEELVAGGLSTVVRFPRRIREQGESSDSFERGRKEALVELSRSRSDVLVWGHVANVSGSKVLRFWSDSDIASELRLDTRIHPYKMDLSSGESRDVLVRTVVALAVINRLGRISTARGAALEPALFKQVLSAEDILESNRGKFRKEDQPELSLVIGEALQTAGEACDDIEAIRRSELYLTRASEEACTKEHINSCAAGELARRWSAMLSAAEVQVTTSRYAASDGQADETIVNAQARIRKVLDETNDNALSAIARHEDPALRLRAQLVMETSYLARARVAGEQRSVLLAKALQAQKDVGEEFALVPANAVDPFTQTMVKINEALARLYSEIARFKPSSKELKAVESVLVEAEKSVSRNERPMLWVAARLGRISAANAYTEDNEQSIQKLESALGETEEVLSLLPAERFPLKRAQTYQLLGILEQRLGRDIGKPRPTSELEAHSNRAISFLMQALQLRQGVRAPGIIDGADDIETRARLAAAYNNLGRFGDAKSILDDMRIHRQRAKGPDSRNQRIDAIIACRLGQSVIGPEVLAPKANPDIRSRCLALREFLGCWSIANSTIKEAAIASAASNGITWICAQRDQEVLKNAWDCPAAIQCALSESDTSTLQQFAKTRLLEQ